EGVYLGKFAELGGEDSSHMLLYVVVVSQQEFDADMEELRSHGYEGQLGVDLNPNDKEWSMREKQDDAGPRYSEDKAAVSEGDNQRAPRPPRHRPPRCRRGSRRNGRRGSADSSSTC